MRILKRYRQPQAGTNDKVVKKDIERYNIDKGFRSGTILDALQHIYKGVIKNDWQ